MISRAHLLVPELLRFGVVGLINTAVSYGLYSLLIFVGFGYPAASFCALCTGIVWSFFTQGRLVFRQRLQGRFPRYLLVWCLLYFANLGFIALLIALGAGPYLAGFIAIVPVTALSFLLQRHFVFVR
ncbi:MAG: GtrA family protein [Proteobacteria bacterium]|nr:GtrA family protein [Pseudomonadota bacterium]